MSEFMILTLFVKVAYHQKCRLGRGARVRDDAYLLVAPKRLSKLVRERRTADGVRRSTGSAQLAASDTTRGKWQATKWSSPIRERPEHGLLDRVDRSGPAGHRRGNDSPRGATGGEGSSPVLDVPGRRRWRPALRGRGPGSGTGIEASRASVYGWAGTPVHVALAPDLAQLAEVHHRDPVADALDDAEVVGDEHHRQPVAAP